jgi:hypothetical protein
MKLKFYIPEILLGILLTLAIFGMGMLFQSSSSHQPPSNPPNSTAEQIQNAHKPDPFSWDWLTHDGVVFFTCVLAFVAGVQAVLFLWQLVLINKSLADAKVAANASAEAAKAATKQAKFAEDSHAKLERPYVFIFGVSKLESDEMISDLPFAPYVVANYGRTPAMVETLRAGISWFPDRPLDPLIVDYRDDPAHGLLKSPVLAPSEKREKLNIIAPHGLDFAPSDDGEIVPQLRDNDNFFVWVIINYRGAFTAAHETSACWRYDGLTNRLVRWGGR